MDFESISMKVFALEVWEGRSRVRAGAPALDQKNRVSRCAPTVRWSFRTPRGVDCRQNQESRRNLDLTMQCRNFYPDAEAFEERQVRRISTNVLPPTFFRAILVSNARAWRHWTHRSAERKQDNAHLEKVWGSLGIPVPRVLLTGS
jgi:hypothetical protein